MVYFELSLNPITKKSGSDLKKIPLSFTMRKACSFFLSTFQHFHFQKILLWIQILLFEKGNFLGSVATEDCSSRGKRSLNIIWMWKSCRIKMSWKIWRRLILLYYCLVRPLDGSGYMPEERTAAEPPGEGRRKYCVQNAWYLSCPILGYEDDIQL